MEEKDEKVYGPQQRAENNPEPTGREDTESDGEEDLSNFPQNSSLPGLNTLTTGLEWRAKDVKKLSAEFKRMREKIHEVRDRLARMEERQSTVSSAQETMKELSEVTYKERIIRPMVNQLFPVFDLAITSTSKANRSDGAESLYQTLKAIRSLLEDFFGIYGIEPFVPRKGGDIDRKSMKVVKVVRTDDESLHGQVRTCRQVGFRRDGDGTVLRPAKVTMWKKAQTAQPQSETQHIKEE